ncbi:MAG: hypothetical protein GF311_23155 [Candidatus Lokiarchaeota archaeon]|nr:hypothetical protein [Candidatus Lokiarchaeota archaeon]MBD3342248.1 hypothetical protein [Candidatus Lokiarchaeota archaeon]
MILIANVGNRDVQFGGKEIEKHTLRKRSKDLLEVYSKVKEKLSFPILSPYFKPHITEDLTKVYLFVTNQEDQRYRKGDTKHFGHILEKWIEETYGIEVNVIDYANDPTNYQILYTFYSETFTQQRNLFEQEKEILASLSGGTPQMNNALYVILSSLYPKKVEFYSVDQGELIPVDHEATINKIFIQKASRELLNIFQYQSIIQILDEYSIPRKQKVVHLLEYAHHRKNFDFEEAQNAYDRFINEISRSQIPHYHYFDLPDFKDPVNLIEELFYNIEMNYKTQNYLMVIALLFRIEEALLVEILAYLFKEDHSWELNNKKNHPQFLEHIKSEEPELIEKLSNIEFKGEDLELERSELNRVLMFYIAFTKVEQMKANGNYIWQIGNVLTLFDRINKYCYHDLSPEKRQNRYKTQIGTECLGDLRNKSIIAHGFKPVSKEEINRLFGDDIECLISTLKKWLEKFIGLVINNQGYEITNFYYKLNRDLLPLINKL